jgi:hypothetical protein
MFSVYENKTAIIAALTVIAAAATARADESPAPLSLTELSVLADGATKTRSLNFQMGDAIHVKLAPGNLARLQAAAAGEAEEAWAVAERALPHRRPGAGDRNRRDWSSSRTGAGPARRSGTSCGAGGC